MCPLVPEEVALPESRPEHWKLRGAPVQRTEKLRQGSVEPAWMTTNATNSLGGETTMLVCSWIIVLDPKRSTNKASFWWASAESALRGPRKFWLFFRRRPENFVRNFHRTSWEPRKCVRKIIFIFVSFPQAQDASTSAVHGLAWGREPGQAWPGILKSQSRWLRPWL